MDLAVNQVETNARRVVLMQVAIAAVVAVVFGLIQGSWQLLSALAGGGISVLSSLLLRRCVLRANEIAATDAKRGMITLYIGAVQRFVLVLALFGVELAVIGLDPLASVVGFGSAQLAYVAVMRISANPGQRKA